jgi:small multidrug resistance pump
MASGMARIVMPAYLTLAVAILAEVVATSLLKASEGFSRLWPSLGTAAGYALAFYALSLTLRTMPVGIAYAIWSGAGIVLISAIGWLGFGQKLDVAAIAGMALILAGVIVINTLSGAAPH